MGEPKLKDKKKVIEKLKPFWKKYWREHSKFVKETRKLEKEMSKKVGMEIDLEFFYVDGECVGIGASDTNDRKKFPLLQISEF